MSNKTYEVTITPVKKYNDRVYSVSAENPYKAKEEAEKLFKAEHGIKFGYDYDYLEFSYKSKEAV